MVIVKTYFATDQFETELPPEFVNAIGRKFIEVRLCWATVDNYLVGDLMLHADWIKRDYYLDHFVNIVNVINGGNHCDKYEVSDFPIKKIKIWFTDLKNNVVVPDAFVLKLLLIYDS